VLTPAEGADRGEEEPGLTLATQMFGEWLTSRAGLASAAGALTETETSGLRLRGALARSTEEAAELLTSLEAEPRHLEFSVQVCARRYAAEGYIHIYIYIYIQRRRSC